MLLTSLEPRAKREYGFGQRQKPLYVSCREVRSDGILWCPEQLVNRQSNYGNIGCCDGWRKAMSSLSMSAELQLE
jgi:hypothetical protein